MIKNFLTYCSQKRFIVCPDIYIGKGTAALLLATTLLFAFAIWGLNQDPSLLDFWKDFPVDYKTIEIFCEKTEMNKLVRQPVNAFSGIVYLIVAIIILKESQNIFKNSSYESQNNENLIHKIFLAFILLYVFLACTFYHASLTNLAFKIDFSSVYFFSLFPVMHLSCRWLLTNEKQSHISKKKITVVVYLVYVAVCLLLSFFAPKGKEHIVTFVCILIFFAFAIATILANPKKTNLNYLVLSVICTMVALVWLKLDKHTILCNPNSYFQPHSLWNLFIGLSGFYFYVFIRNEHQPTKII